ncbi:MAG: hypothetical protein QXP52_00210 [Candidatus Aenigmatarchaeota archaeon]
MRINYRNCYICIHFNEKYTLCERRIGAINPNQGACKDFEYKFKNSYEALQYCIYSCPLFSLGCSLKCDIRKDFNIPPWSKKYPTKTVEVSLNFDDY